MMKKTILSLAAILVMVGGVAACSDSKDDGRAGAGGEGVDGRDTTTTTSVTTGGGTGVDDTGGRSGGDDTGTNSTGGDDTGGDDTGGDDTGGGGIADCSEEVGDGCRDCCLQVHADGAEALTTMMFEHCGCGTGAPCAAECNTTIAATDVCVDDGSINLEALGGNAACVQCTRALDQNAACIGQLAAACAADVACSAYILCARDCIQP